MSGSKLSQRLGLLLSSLLALFVIYHYEDFLAVEEWGNTMLLVSLGCSIVVLFSVSYKWEKLGWLRCIFQLFFFAAVPFFMLIAVERLNGGFITGFLVPEEDILANYIVYLLFYLLAFALSGSVRVSVLTISPILLLFGIANMYIKEFKGSPFLPIDFTSIKTAANVASGYTYDVGYEMVFAIAITAAIMAVAARHGMPKMKIWLKIPTRGLSLAVVCGFAFVFFFTDVFADYGLKPDFFNQTRGYKNHGAVLSFTLNTKYLTLSKPMGYDADDIYTIVEEGTEGETPHILETALVRQGMDPDEAKSKVSSVETIGSTGVSPNIIVIMNESYSDLRVVGDIETNEPFMDYVDSLKDSTIQGNVYVSTIGTGTSNTEFEFLTGNTMAFLPAGSNAYQLYVKMAQPGLTATLLNHGYTADAFHPYFESSWNRTAVYDLMGFRDFITTEDMFGQDLIDEYIESGYSTSLYQRLLKQRFPGEDILLRRFVSDAYDFNELIKMYENKGDEPMFVFNVTMQSHSSYDKQYDNFKEEVELTNLEGDYPKTDQYLSLIKKTDDAFEDLLNYFEQQEEPTVILMFGDHQPFIENGFYNEVMGESISEMDDETQQRRYITRFILWANYDIPTGWIEEISMNYLSTLLMQVVGFETPVYNDYLANLYTKVPVITGMGCRDAEGNFFQADQDNNYESEILGYRMVQYNNLADIKNRADDLFYLGGGENG